MKSQTLTVVIKYTLNFMFVLFLFIMNIFPSQGLFNLEVEESEEKIRPYTTLLVQSMLDKKRSGSSNKTSIQPILIDEKADDLSDLLSDSYMLSFKDDSEERGSRLLVCKYIASLLGGLGASIPQVGIAIQVGEHYGSKELGYGLVATTILCTGGITSWMIWELIEDAQEIIKPIQQSLRSSNVCNRQLLKRASAGILSLILGVLSSTPEVYKTYKYNPTKEMSIITFAYETIPRTLGFYKLFSSINFKPKICQEGNVLRNQGLEFIDLSKVYLLNLCKENGIENVILALKDHSTPEKVYTYLSHSQPSLFEATEETLPYSYANGVPRKIAQSLMLIFPIGSACIDLILAHRGYSLFIDNPTCLTSLSIISTLPNFVLNSYVATEVAGSLFDKAYLYLSKSKISSSDYFGTFYPKVKIAFIGTSLFLATSAVGGGVYFIVDNLDNTFSNSFRYTLIALGVTSNVMFGTYTITNTLTNFGELIAKKRNKETSYLLNCLKKLNDARKLIIDSNLGLIRSFIDRITPFFTDNSVHEMTPVNLHAIDS